jgi:Holliday junction resolvase|tara:strand:- start:21 stop:341 length:321 start_codon:yes stop_codon:yes gene_type:complete
MGGRASSSKGYRGEKQVQAQIAAHGHACRRVPLSGAAQGWPGDLVIDLPDAQGLIVECKVRADGFRQLYQWLEGADVLTVKADRRPALAVLDLDTYSALLAKAHGT